MLRCETEAGYWLITHVDHARLAGDFAEKWGNALFSSPEPRERVLKGISRHDDGWRLRDAVPQITRAGKPSAFSAELVGKYSAFEEIDLADYLDVRDRAVRLLAEDDAYAAMLVSMHTYNLLTERADRATIAPAQLFLLDNFLDQQRAFQRELRSRIAIDGSLHDEEKSEAVITDHFRLLQAVDNLSLLACVDFSAPATLLHPLPTSNAGHTTVAVKSLGERSFALDPYPFAEPSLTFKIPARRVASKAFETAVHLQQAFVAAPVSELAVTILEMQV